MTPFDAGLPPVSRQQVALRALLGLAEGVRQRLERNLQAKGVSLQQFNVLRVLVEAGDGGLPTLAVADRLLERAPGVTRLMDRLERQGLVLRTRGVDRRQVICSASKEGASLVQDLLPEVAQVEESILSCLNPNELGALLHFLNRVQGKLTA
jgi:DNA-binding MarR family transcriptional regulator